VEFVRQGLYIAREAGALLPDLLQLIANGHLPMAPTFGHFLNSEREHGEPLANVVVQFPGDVAALFFLGGDQLAAYLFQCLSRQLLIGNINADPMNPTKKPSTSKRGFPTSNIQR
jgi:hypothetical protein